MSRTIALSQGKVTVVDDADFDWLNQWKWAYDKHKHGGYARCYITSEKRHIRMHRLILAAPAGMECDHISGDGLDNRRANLRLCTKGQNHMNMRKAMGCTSKFKGVYWNRQKGKWQAQIVANGTRRSLGRFNDEYAAARAYNDAAREHFGVFARLNEL